MATGAVTEKARVFKTEHAFEWAFGIGFVLIAVAKLIAQGQPILGGFIASVLGIAIMCLYRITVVACDYLSPTGQSRMSSSEL